MDLNKGDTRLIIDACKSKGVLRNQCAYALSTTYLETAHTMKPIYERGAKAYFNKYEPGTKIGKNLGNTAKGDGFLYRGRGFTQITGRANYLKAGNKLKIDLIRNPDLALNPKIAAQILVIGMMEGWFTGKKLFDYISLMKSDFIGARRIINGTDKAGLIAGYAKDFDALLKAEGYGVDLIPDRPSVVIVEQRANEPPVVTKAPVGAPTPAAEHVERNPFWKALFAILKAIFGGKK